MAKGSVLDLLFIGVVLLTLALIAPMIFHVSQEFKTQAEGDINTTYVDYGITFLKGVDTAFIFIAIGACAMTVIAAFYIDSHPAFYVVTLVISLIIAWVSTHFSNIFETISEHSTLATTFNEFAGVINVMTILPYFLIVFSMLVAVVVYSKGRIGGGI
jgi:hypothetical protein